MGSKELAVLIELSDATGGKMNIKDPALAQGFLNNYVAALKAAAAAALPAVPRIGQVWAGQGGVYAGPCRGIDGGNDYHLFVHADDHDGIKWQNAVDWAKGLQADGHSDFALPTRKEQAVLFGNVPELFQQKWYWSGEQHASGPEYAWSQDFSGGSQNYHWKTGDEIRARAVRRVLIQS